MTLKTPQELTDRKTTLHAKLQEVITAIKADTKPFWLLFLARTKIEQELETLDKAHPCPHCNRIYWD